MIHAPIDTVFLHEMAFDPKRLSALIEKRFGSSAAFAVAAKVSENTVTNWLKGYTKPKIDQVVNMADVLGVTVSYLVGETDKPDRFQKLREEFKDLPSEEVERVIDIPSHGVVLPRLVPEGLTDEQLEDIIKRNELTIKRITLELLRAEQEALEEERNKRKK